MRLWNVKIVALLILLVTCSCRCTKDIKTEPKTMNLTAEQILGNPEYLAISYGGYRYNTRSKQPTIAELKEDLKILSALGIKLLRTYNVQLPHAANVLEAIKQLKQKDANFEMYVMLGAWIDCKNAWTGYEPNHYEESQHNEAEILRTVALAQKYPEIVKIIAVGNEAMVKWATSYYVQPSVILKWVNYLQNTKKEGLLSEDLWITSSDNFASWGGGSAEYHTPDLVKLIKAVDYISMHTYPMHDTHYNPGFWKIPSEDSKQSSKEIVDHSMERALLYAQSQYLSVKAYLKSLGVNKPVHIGETGWATFSNEHYGNQGSRATDEYKGGLFYQKMREWTNKENIACFYFEAFDESWKDVGNPQGSENHFGLFTIDGKAKYAIWDWVDKGAFKGLTRKGHPITKTYQGNKEELMKTVLIPPM